MGRTLGRFLCFPRACVCFVAPPHHVSAFNRLPPDFGTVGHRKDLEVKPAYSIVGIPRLFGLSSFFRQHRWTFVDPFFRAPRAFFSVFGAHSLRRLFFRDSWSTCARRFTVITFVVYPFLPTGFRSVQTFMATIRSYDHTRSRPFFFFFFFFFSISLYHPPSSGAPGGFLFR